MEDSGSQLKSVVTSVLSKTIVAPWDADHEASLAPAKMSKRDDRGCEYRNRHSDKGQDDFYQKRHFANGHQVPEAAREVQLVLAPHRAVVPPNPELTIQLESLPPGTRLPRMKVQLELAPHRARLPRTGAQLASVPPGTRLPRVRVQLEPAPHGAGLPWTIQLGVSSRGDQTTADKHSGHGSSGSCTSKNGGSAGDVCLGDQTAVNRASGHGTSSSGKEGSFAVKFSWAGAGSESLTTANSQGGVGSQSYGNWQSWHNRQGIISEPDARYGWGQRYGRHGSNRHCTGGLHCNTPQAIWGHSPLSSLASHSHPYSSLLPRTVALERVQTEPWKLYQFSLQCQLMTENMAVPPVSVPVMTGLHNPSSMAVPSTGMDVLYGPSDLAAQMGTSNM